MRKILLVLTVALVMAAMTVATALPVFAANCIANSNRSVGAGVEGPFLSDEATTTPGLVGESLSFTATELDCALLPPGTHPTTP